MVIRAYSITLYDILFTVAPLRIAVAGSIAGFDPKHQAFVMAPNNFPS